MCQRIMFAIGLGLLAALLAVRLASPVAEMAPGAGDAGIPAAAADGMRPVGGGNREKPIAAGDAAALPLAPERRLNTLPLPQMIRERLAGLIEPPALEQPVLKREMLAAAAAASTVAVRTGKGRSGGRRRPPEEVPEGVPTPEDGVEEDEGPRLRLWRRFSENVLGELELTLLLQDDGAMLSGGAVVLRQQLPPGWEMVAVRPEPQVRPPRPRQLKWLLVPAEPTRELLVQMVLRPLAPGASAAAADRASWSSTFRCRPATGEIVSGVGCDLP